MAQISPASQRVSLWPWVYILALVYFSLHLVTSTRYGYFRDALRSIFRTAVWIAEGDQRTSKLALTLLNQNAAHLRVTKRKSYFLFKDILKARTKW